MDSVSFEVRHRHDGAAEVRLAGELDLCTGPDVAARLGRLLDTAPVETVVVDLGGLSYCDCTGLNVFANAQRDAVAVGKTIVLVRARGGVVGELVTKAVWYAGTPIGVHWAWSNGDAPRLRVKVCDESDAMPQVVEPPRPAGHGGYGLRLLERFSNDWGVERHDRGGKCVWFEVGRIPDRWAGDSDVVSSQATT